MYSCGTSAPATLPLFMMVAPTVATTAYNPAVPPGIVVVLPAAELMAEIVSAEYANVVYDNPNPNSYLGVIAFLSKCL